MEEGIKQDRKSITVSKLYELWLSVKRGLKDNTLESYKYFYYSFIEPRLGNRKVSDLKRSDIRGFYNYLHEVRGLKTASIDNVHTVLHQLLDLAVQDDYIRYNPSDNALSELKRAVGKDEKKKALTVLEQDLFENFLLSHPEYRQWYPVFVLMLRSGLRVGETTGLRWDDIDFKTGFISVNHTLVYYAKGKRPKKESRALPLICRRQMREKDQFLFCRKFKKHF